MILLINLLFKTGCKLFCIQFWGEGGGGSNLILLSLLTLVHVGLFLSSIGPGGLGFVLWVTTFPFVKFLPGFGTRYKFLNLDVFDFDILVRGGAPCSVILNNPPVKY